MPRKVQKGHRMLQGMTYAWQMLYRAWQDVLWRWPALRRSKALFLFLVAVCAICLWYYGMLGFGTRRRHRKSHADLTPDLDYSGEYMIVGPLFGNDAAFGSAHNVILTTHCSLGNVHELFSLLEAWHGPASVAVFVDVADGNGGAVDSALRALQLLVACHDGVWVYVVHPVAVSINLRTLAAVEPASCAKLLDDLQAVSRLRGAVRNYDSGSAARYPGNLLRNVALHRAQPEDYVLCVDVDMVPSADLHGRLARFLAEMDGGQMRGPRSKTAYVLPCFESKHGKGVSLDRPTLQRLWRLGLVRPFYAEACPQCQSTTDYERWMALDAASAGVVGTAYEVTRQRSDAWEPFYTARKLGLPAYDERFKQYGYNRISQICEMYMAGYRFVVLDNAFLVHKGFKTEASFHASKKAELENNTKLYRQFRWEMKERYPGGLEC